MILTIEDAKLTLGLDDDLDSQMLAKLNRVMKSVDRYVSNGVGKTVAELENNDAAKEAARMLLLQWFDNPIGNKADGGRHGITSLLLQSEYCIGGEEIGGAEVNPEN